MADDIKDLMNYMLQKSFRIRKFFIPCHVGEHLRIMKVQTNYFFSILDENFIAFCYSSKHPLGKNR